MNDIAVAQIKLNVAFWSLITKRRREIELKRSGPGSQGLIRMDDDYLFENYWWHSNPATAGATSVPFEPLTDQLPVIMPPLFVEFHLILMVIF